jgi:hypothetical protein
MKAQISPKQKRTWATSRDMDTKSQGLLRRGLLCHKRCERWTNPILITTK